MKTPEQFVDLHCHSYFSILDGYPAPEDVVRKAAELGRDAVALTDHGSVSGHVLFEKAFEGFTQRQIGADTLKVRTGEKLAIKPIFGVEAYVTRSVAEPERRKHHLTVLAQNQQGYRNISKLVTESYERGFHYRPTMDGEMLANRRDGLIILSGCESGSIMRSLEDKDYAAAQSKAERMRDVFGDAFYIELQHFPHMQPKVRDAYELAQHLGVKPILTCDAHYTEPDDAEGHSILYAIRDRCTIDNSFIMYGGHPWAPDELYAHVMKHHPGLPWDEIFANTVEVSQRIEDYRLPRAPHVEFQMEGDKIQYVRNVCLSYLEDKGHADDPEYLSRLDRELNVIDDKGYIDYFLVVADMVRWAKDNGILVGPARGSAAGSLVCWGLRVTEIDPMQWGLMFERFVDPTRVDLPDIDVDFEDERRVEVMGYMKERYGEENVANIATFAKFGDRSTLNDISRVFSIPKTAINEVERFLVHRSSGDQRVELTIMDALQEPAVQNIFSQYPDLAYATKIQGKIRHMGKHAAGLIVTSEPITDYMAVYTNKQSGERLVAVDHRDASYLNLMKIDVLGLKELTIIRMIAERIGMRLEDVYNIPLDDAATLKLFNDRDFLGIFQFEGLAVRSVADLISFEGLREIADVNAMARPGPLHAGATEAYIKGKAHGNYHPVIKHELVQPIIAPTYGQIIYQETIMRILREVGSMSWQDVCDIRTIMGKSKGSEAFDEYWPVWREGTDRAGLIEQDAREIWECIRHYGKHAFNASHAFAYGLLAYWSAYYKVHHPKEFYWAQLCKAAGADEEGRFIMEAQRKGIEFAPISLQLKSERWDIDDDGRIAPGWSTIAGIGPVFAKRLAASAPYADLADMIKRASGIGVKKAETIEPWLGRTVHDIYQLYVWDYIAQIAPDRIPLSEARVKHKGLYVGRVIKINKKSRREEWTQKGKDTSRLNPDALDEYAILTLEDETGGMMVYVSPELYAIRHDTIWNNPTRFLAVEGTRSVDVRLIAAKDIVRINMEEQGNESDTDSMDAASHRDDLHTVGSVQG